MESITELGCRAKAVSTSFASLPTAKKDLILETIAHSLENNIPQIIEANAIDLQNADKSGMRESLRDRLMLNDERIRSIASAVRAIISLEDPIGRVDRGSIRPNGLKIYKTRVPLGVVGMIFEARPNVTVDAAALCIKSGNACILRGGKEAINSNIALAGIMRRSIEQCGVSPDIVQLVEDTSRDSSLAMMTMNEYLDVLIPRGGAGLIQAVVKNSTVPVIETGVGNCHVYIDSFADIDMAVKIIDNAKTSRPSVCNAAETLLVHSSIAEIFLPRAKAALDRHNVELRCCPVAREILCTEIPATEEDYATEFGDYILAVKVVDSFDEAIEHISKYSSGHSEAIVTESYSNAQRFTSEVDAAAVYVNASTRFTDGGEFGLGAEIGISTQKLHTRGPMGLDDLTTVKYIVYGNGQIR